MQAPWPVNRPGRCALESVQASNGASVDRFEGKVTTVVLDQDRLTVVHLAFEHLHGQRIEHFASGSAASAGERRTPDRSPFWPAIRARPVSLARCCRSPTGRRTPVQLNVDDLADLLRLSGLKITISSMRFRNSGRKCCRSASITCRACHLRSCVATSPRCDAATRGCWS